MSGVDRISILDRMTSIKYRPEIDGLRAISVLAVIFFHADFSLFKGGFIGVDVFFVISGYLITSILVKELQGNCFSLVQFYVRRIKRILPALTIVVLITSLFAWNFLFPREMEEFSNSLIAVALMVSNIFFWKHSGYFETASEMKPLLHFWSLSVEEQFYVFFPLYLAFLWRLGKKYTLGGIGLFFFLSLMFSQSLTSQGEASASFFLLPSRGWEMLLGSALAVYEMVHEQEKVSSSILGQWASSIGLTCILLSCTLFNNHSPLPGLLSLIPTIGTALIIVYASPTNIVGSILSNKLLVHIGLLSYSAYLWHQPIFVFTRIQYDSINIWTAGIAILTSFILAYITWRFIEQPFRKLRSQKLIICMGLSSIGILTGLGLYLNSASKSLNRFPLAARPTVEQASLNVSHAMKALDRGGCFIDYDQTFQDLIRQNCASKASPKFLLFGDSRAAHHLPGLKTLTERVPRYHGFLVEQWTAASCRAIDVRYNSKRCHDFYSAFVEKILPTLDEKTYVIVSSAWLWTLNAVPEKEFEASFESLLNQLKKSQAQVVIIGETPSYSGNPFRRLFREGRVTQDQEMLEINNSKYINTLLSQISQRYSLRFIDPTPYLCSKDSQFCLVKHKNQFVYYDQEHLSPFGSALLWERLDNHQPLINH